MAGHEILFLGPAIGKNKSDITCLTTSWETFTYNTHNSAQAKLTAAVELQITVTTNYATVGILQKLRSNRTQYSESAEWAVSSCASS